MSQGPLQGIRVLDASMGAVGPWAGCLLGQLGADVVKLESPQGDFIRNVMPSQKGLSATYISMNFNKRGVVLDLKVPEQRNLAHELVAKADVFIENFRPGVAERIGLGYEELKALNPRLIYASASGFGSSGPLVKLGATDPHIQAFTGSCVVNGEPGGLRQRMRWYGHFDVTTSMCIVQAVLTALYDRDRTGKGQRAETTMVDAAMSLQRVRISEHLAGGAPVRMGSATTYVVPDQAFPTCDGHVFVSATSRRQWRRLCDALGLPHVSEDERFATNPRRVENRDDLIPELEAVLSTRPTWYWVQVLSKAGVPAARVHSLEELREHAHILANGMLRTFDTAHWGPITVSGIPWRFEGTPATLWPGPLPGEQTKEIIAGGWPGVDAGKMAARSPECNGGGETS